MKKFASIAAASVLAISTAFFPLNASHAQAPSYSGEEIFEGFVFAQGELGEKLDRNFSADAVEILNTKEGQLQADLIVEKIKEADAEFFTKFEEAVYAKDAQKVDELLTEAGSLVEAELNVAQKSLGQEYSARGLVNYVETANFVAVATVLLLVISLIDITPVAGKEGLSKEMAIKDLLNEVN